MTVSLKGDVPMGRFSNVLELTTNDIEEAVKRIRVEGYVDTPVEVLTPLVTFGLPAGTAQSDDARALARLASPYGRPIRVRRAKATPGEAFSCDLADVQSAADGGVTVPITFKRSVKNDYVIKGLLELELEVAGEPYVRTAELYAISPKAITSAAGQAGAGPGDASAKPTDPR